MMKKGDNDSSSSSNSNDEKEDGEVDPDKGVAKVPPRVPLRAAAAVAPSGRATTYSSSSTSDSGEKMPGKKKAQGKKREGGGGKKSPQKNPSSSTTSVLTAEQRWEEMFVRLQGFRNQHGHANVPNRYEQDPQLGCWVSTQRRQYKKAKQNKSVPTKLSRQRINRLTQLGFEWEGQNPRHKNWDVRFQALLDFKANYGHAQVPIGWEEDVQLANWTSTQRQEYKNLVRGKPSRLDERRIQLLNSVGFAWELQRGGRRRQLSVDPENDEEAIDSNDRVGADDDDDDADDSTDAAQSGNKKSKGKKSKRKKVSARHGSSGGHGSGSLVLPGIAIIGGDSRPSTSGGNADPSRFSSFHRLPRSSSAGRLPEPSSAPLGYPQAPAPGGHHPASSESRSNAGQHFSASLFLPATDSSAANDASHQRQRQTFSLLQSQSHAHLLQSHSQTMLQPQSHQAQQSAMALFLQNQTISPEIARSLLLAGTGGIASRDPAQDTILQQARENQLRLLSNVAFTSGSQSSSGQRPTSSLLLHWRPGQGQHSGGGYPYQLQQGPPQGTNLGASQQLLHQRVPGVAQLQQSLNTTPGRISDGSSAPWPLDPTMAQLPQSYMGGDVGGEAKHPGADRPMLNSSSSDEEQLPRSVPPKKRRRP